MADLQTFVLIAPVLLFSMVAHEYAHGYAALRQGDSTAANLGRLTWNPLKHIDPFMTVLLPIMTFFAGGFIFGGAKPVPVQPANFREYVRGDIIVSLAGVASNAVLVVVCAVLFAAVGALAPTVPAAYGAARIAQQVLSYGILFNFILIFFNLLPIPPLDGSHVVKHLLPPAWQRSYVKIGAFGLIVLVGLLTIGRPILDLWMAPMWALQGAIVRVLAPWAIPIGAIG